MVVYEDRVEPVFLAELCSLYNTLEGFVGCKKGPGSEPDLTLHTSATRGLWLMMDC